MEAGDFIAQFFVQVLFPIISSVLMVLVSYLVLKIAKKYNIDISEQDKNYIESLTMKAIGFAEEYAADKARNDINIKGSEKLELAITFLSNKMPTIDREQAKNWIISALSEIKGVGATGDKTICIEAKCNDPACREV